jgi:hypothetical protein
MKLRSVPECGTCGNLITDSRDGIILYGSITAAADPSDESAVNVLAGDEGAEICFCYPCLRALLTNHEGRDVNGDVRIRRKPTASEAAAEILRGQRCPAGTIKVGDEIDLNGRWGKVTGVRYEEGGLAGLIGIEIGTCRVAFTTSALVTLRRPGQQLPKEADGEVILVTDLKVGDRVFLDGWRDVTDILESQAGNKREIICATSAYRSTLAVDEKVKTRRRTPVVIEEAKRGPDTVVQAGDLQVGDNFWSEGRNRWYTAAKIDKPLPGAEQLSMSVFVTPHMDEIPMLADQQLRVRRLVKP